MQRITVAEAKKDFSSLIHRVETEGVSFELAVDDRVVARLTPPDGQPGLRVKDLEAFLQGLPRLGEDSEAFSENVRSFRRSFPAEKSAWE